MYKVEVCGKEVMRLFSLCYFAQTLLTVRVFERMQDTRFILTKKIASSVMPEARTLKINPRICKHKEYFLFFTFARVE